MTTNITNDNIVSVAASKLTGAMPALDGSALTSITGTAEDAYSLAILNRFEIAKNHDLATGTAGQGVFDEFSADTLATKTGATYDATNDLYSNAGGITSTNFAYTGATADYNVPAGVTSITFKAWGAGGGGGAVQGGGGGFVQETITVTPSETLTVAVGGGGVYASNGGSKKGGGGGWTNISRSSTPLAGAGAGGGSAANANSIGGSGGGAVGGPGFGRGTQPLGGTQSAGGFAGNFGTAGSYLTGGRGAPGSSVDAPGGFNGGGIGDGDNVVFTSGGGGGGYYGGGGGGGTTGSDGSGAGGSGYAPNGGTNTGASGSTVANSGDADYPGSVGNGGASQTSGQNGYAKIIYLSTVTNTVLESNSSTITADPTDLRFDFIITETDALTLGTDITVKGSRDGGTTFTAATLTKVGTLPTGESHIKAEVVVSGQPSGTAMRYKLETFNTKEMTVKYVYQLPIYA